MPCTRRRQEHTYTSYNLHHQLIQFPAHLTKYKDAPHKGTRYRLTFTKPTRPKLTRTTVATRSTNQHKPPSKPTPKQNAEQVLTFTLLPVQTSPKVAAARKAFLQALAATPFPCIRTTRSRSGRLGTTRSRSGRLGTTRSRSGRLRTTRSRRATITTQPTTLTIDHQPPPEHHPHHNLYHALTRYMDAFSPGVFGASNEHVYRTCSITKGTQRNWAREKEPGNAAFTTVGTYSSGELLVENDTAINALRQSGNLPTVSPKSYTASVLGIALRYNPSLTGYVVERMLPLNTRPAFCRLLREQSGVSAIHDNDLPRVAVRKMCAAQQRGTAKQSFVITKMKQTAVLLLQTLGLCAVLGYQYYIHYENFAISRDNRKMEQRLNYMDEENNKMRHRLQYMEQNNNEMGQDNNKMRHRLQYLLGSAIKSFERQYGQNCVIHALNNATYWHRKKIGLRQIGAIEVDLIEARYGDGRSGIWWWWNAHTTKRTTPNTLLNPDQGSGYTPFVAKKILTEKMHLKVSEDIYTLADFKKKYGTFGVSGFWRKKERVSFVALIIMNKLSQYDENIPQILHTGLHMTSLRREPNSNMWLYQDSNLPNKQHLINDNAKELWNFLKKTSPSPGYTLEMMCCFFIWS